MEWVIYDHVTECFAGLGFFMLLVGNFGKALLTEIIARGGMLVSEMRKSGGRTGEGTVNMTVVWGRFVGLSPLHGMKFNLH